MQGFSESMVQIMNFSFDRYVIGNSSSPSNISSSLLFLTLTQSRQAWTNTIFKRYSLPTPAVETDQQAKGKEAGSSGEHPPASSTQQTNTEHVQNQTATQKTSISDSSDGQMAQTEPQPSKPHRASTSSSKPSASPSLQSLSICKDTYKLVAENVTLIIGPHIFRDTRFYAGWKAGGKGLLVLFEFKESPETLWTFPQNASVERMNFAPPFEVLASFHLPSGVFDELAGSTKSIINPKSSSKSTGFLNMQMLNVPKELFQCIQIYTNDPLITFSEVLSKFKASSQQSQKSRLLNLPSLPFPSNIWSSVPGSVSRQPAGLSDSLFKRSSSHSLYQSTSAAATSASIASQARRKKSVHVPYTRPHTSSTTSAESAHQPPSSTPSSMIKRKRIAQDELAFSATPEKLSISTHRQQSTPTSSQSSKKCAYCGTKTTPMWRRGPDGAGTLCNACGVKWKHGKIYIAPSRTSSQSKKEYLETPTSISTDNASQLESADSLLQTSADSPELSSHTLKIEESPQSSNSVDEEGDVAAPLKKRRM